MLRGKALERSLNYVSVKNFINCFDFHPQARSFYYFAKKSKVNNVININHANYSENNIFWDGKNNNGSFVSSGTYILKVINGLSVDTKKIIYVK